MIDATRREMMGGGAAFAAAKAAADRQRPLILSVADFGASGDGQDQTAAVQQAYDALAGHGGGTLFFPPGSYPISLTLTSRDVHLRGAGGGSTRLLPARPGAAVITAFYRNGAQTAVSVSDLDLVGTDSFQSTLFLAGGLTYSKNAEFSGGTHFARVRFHNADKCIERRFGCIVLIVDQCTFTDANYHIYTTASDGSQGGAPMHGGCTSVTRSRLLGFRKAMFYLRSPVQGSGQITFSENIVENGEGFVFYIDGCVATRVPTIVIRDQWNENTANGRGLTIGDHQHDQALFLHARNCTSPILIENTPLSSVRLERSTLRTRDCDLTDFTYAGDAASTVSHEGAYAFSGTAPGVCSTIAGPSLPAGLRTPWFTMALPLVPSATLRTRSLQRFDGSAPIPFSGSRMASSRTIDDSATGATAQEVTLNRGDALSMPPFAVRTGQWLAISYAARLVAGGSVEIQLNGARGMSGPAEVRTQDWIRLVGIVEATSDSSSQYLLHRTEIGATLRIGSVFIMAFDTRQQAVDYVNSGVFPA